MIILKNIKNFSRYPLNFAGAFSSTKQVMQDINHATEKVKARQTVADLKKLQNFLHESTVNKGLNMAINRTARYDEEFKKFLDSYKEKNKKNANIIDLSHYAQDQAMGNKTQKMREEEIMMLEEFRKRKQEGVLNLDEQIDEEKKNKMKRGQFEEELNKHLSELYIGEDFMICILERDSTTLVTKLNRINHFRYLVFAGNANGVIGYGKGKGNDFETALNDAIRQCKKNLIAISLDHLLTLPLPITTTYNGLELQLRPRDSMNAWGNPTMATMLMLAGVSHVGFKIVARNMSQYNMVYAFFKAMTALKSPKELSEHFGMKIYHNSFAPWQYSTHPDRFKP